MGAAYVVTGSVNQSCVESGASDAVQGDARRGRQADVAMAPAADMFEMGVKLQVLKRAPCSRCGPRKLFELYQAYDGLESLPAADAPGWRRRSSAPAGGASGQDCVGYFARRDPEQLARAERQPQAQDGPGVPLVPGDVVALGGAGEPDRARRLPGLVRPGDGQLQRWVTGSYLKTPGNRRVAEVGAHPDAAAPPSTPDWPSSARLACTSPCASHPRPGRRGPRLPLESPLETPLPCRRA